MASKITKLTSEELHDIIESANKRVLNEMETYNYKTHAEKNYRVRA